MDDNRRRLKEKLQNSYNAILSILKQYKIDADALIKLKQRFGDKIDSPRRIDRIKSLTDLLDQLDRQLLIDYNDIKNLIPIIEICNIQNGIHELQIEHHKLLIDYNYLFFPNNVNLDNNNGNGETHSDHDIPAYVSEKIVSSIGSSWKEFAYALGLISQDIDRIYSNGKEYKHKAREVMNIFIATNHSHKRDILLEALEAVRRNRLKNEIKHMLLKSCNECRCNNIGFGS